MNAQHYLIRRTAGRCDATTEQIVTLAPEHWAAKLLRLVLPASGVHYTVPLGRLKSRVAAEQHASIGNYNSALRQRMQDIKKDRELIRVELDGSRRVLSRLESEIELQDAAIAQAQAERVSPSLLEAHRAELSALRADDRTLRAEIDRLTAADNPKF